MRRLIWHAHFVFEQTHLGLCRLFWCKLILFQRRGISSKTDLPCSQERNGPRRFNVAFSTVSEIQACDCECGCWVFWIVIPYLLPLGDMARTQWHFAMHLSKLFEERSRETLSTFFQKGRVSQGVFPLLLLLLLQELLRYVVATRTDLVRDVVRRRRAFRGLKTSSEEIKKSDGMCMLILSDFLGRGFCQSARRCSLELRQRKRVVRRVWFPRPKSSDNASDE